MLHGTARPSWRAVFILLSRTNRSALIAGLVLVALLFGMYLVYKPGLTGTFLFDDYVNLNDLGTYGGVHDWQSLRQFVLSGHAGPTKRPVSTLSFLLDDVDWPSNPRPFLYHNILFHVLTTTLVGWLALRLARSRGATSSQELAAAGLSILFWGFHPLWVSTVLYIVQRMAILATIFVVAGLLAYVVGRQRLAEGHPIAGYALMSLGIGAGTVLATLSKENGILLPLLALVVEYSWLRHLRRRTDGVPIRAFQIWCLVFLILPTLTWIGYFAFNFETRVLSRYALEPFSLSERVLTQARILWQYVAQMAFPRPQSAALFHDTLTVSTSLLNPLTTLACVVAWIGIIFAAIRYVRKWPAACGAILFFLAGHALESTVIPLELYFEHRNYLPAVGLAIGLALITTQTISNVDRRLFAILPIGLALLLPPITWARASLWGDPARLATIWAHENPQSQRARVSAARLLYAEGHPAAALQQLEALIEDHPENALARLQHLHAACQIGGATAEHSARAIDALQNAGGYSESITVQLGHLSTLVLAGTCFDAVQPETIRSLYNAAEAHRAIEVVPKLRQRLMFERARFELATHNPAPAARYFHRAVDSIPVPEAALASAAHLASEGHYDSALEFVDKAERLATKKRSANGGKPTAAMLKALDILDYAAEARRMRDTIVREKATVRSN